MRKSLLLPLAALLCMVASCELDSDGNKSTAKMSYYGSIDSIKFTNEADSALQTLIVEALRHDSVFYYIFKEEATINYSSTEGAKLACNYYAVEDMRARAKKVTLDGLKSTMYNLYSADSLSSYSSYTEIPLSAMNIYYSLLSYGYYTDGQFSAIYNDVITLQ